jgi:tetratricopeptide (TPR) repeat protein
MAKAEWYRNSEWNPEIEAAFFEKLRRARDKAQYLKLQAAHLAKPHPQVALSLLDQFFALGEEYFLPDAHVAAANAYLFLGQTDRAVEAYKKALEAERQRPSYRTTAWNEFVLLVAGHPIESEFDEAIRVLNENRSDLVFPKLVFAWHGAYALIQAQRGHREEAKDHAIKALDAAHQGHSGFRRDPKIGLIGKEHDDIKRKLQQLTGKNFWKALAPWAISN